MNINKILPITEARRKIFDLAREVQKPGIYYILTHRGQPKVALISAEEFESWIETLEVIKEFPEIEKDIKRAEEEYEKGEYMTLEELLVKEGYILKDKGKRKYEISGYSSKKSSKGNK